MLCLLDINEPENEELLKADERRKSSVCFFVRKESGFFCRETERSG